MLCLAYRALRKYQWILLDKTLYPLNPLIIKQNAGPSENQYQSFS